MAYVHPAAGVVEPFVDGAIVLVIHGKAEPLNSVPPQQRASRISRPAMWQWIMTHRTRDRFLRRAGVDELHPRVQWLPLTPWNPGLGLAFASLIVGPHYGICVIRRGIIAEIVVLQSNLEWPVIVAIGAIVAAGYTFIATVIRGQFRLDVGLSHLRDVFILLVAAFVGSALVTLLLAGVLLTAGKLSLGDIDFGCTYLDRRRCTRHCCYNSAHTCASSGDGVNRR